MTLFDPYTRPKDINYSEQRRKQENARNLASNYQFAQLSSSGGVVALDSSGRLLTGDNFRSHTDAIGGAGGLMKINKNYMGVSHQSASELNRYLDENNYSLTPGEGRSVVGFKTLQTAPVFRGLGKTGIAGRRPGNYSPTETIAIYGPASTPQPKREAPPPETYKPKPPNTDGSSATDWYGRMQGSGGGQASPPSGPRPDADPANPGIYGAIADRGGEYQRRFGGFIKGFDSQAQRQGWEVGEAGREALSRLDPGVKIPTLDDPLSKERADKMNDFMARIKFA